MYVNRIDDMENVLKRIEKKIISSENIYGAMNYAVWTIILSAYLITESILYMYVKSSVGGWIYGVFWGMAFAIVIYINAILWKKSKQLGIVSKNENHAHIIMFLGWLVGGVLWSLISFITSDPWVYVAGFLIFISCGNAGIAFSIRDYRASMPIITSLISIPLLPRSAGYIAWTMAVEFVLIGYAISALLYMWAAFTLAGEN